jgi:putative DNA primase/helicase
MVSDEGEIKVLLEQCELSDDPTNNFDNAKKFIVDHLKIEPKATAEYIITHELCDYFKLDSKEIKPLKGLHKSVLAKVKEEAIKAEKERKEADKKAKEEAEIAEKARREEESKAEKARKIEEKNAKEETKAKPKKPRVPFDIVADRVMHENFIFTMHDTREFYIYEDGLYSNDGSATKVKDLARKKYKEVYVEFCIKMGVPVPVHIKEPGKAYTEEVLEKIRIDTVVSRQDIDEIQRKNKYRINLKNCIYNLETGRAEPHAPSYKMIRQIPVEYNPDAGCPNIMTFLKEVVYEEDKRVLIEVAGYSLIPDTKIQKAILLYGDGANGKSIFLLLLRALLGSKNVSHESLQQLQDNTFSVANLYGKLANIHADLKSSVIKYDDVFKTIVGGDELRGERKYQHAFTFHNTARLIFSANTQNIPAVKKDDFAYFRRWILIEFTNQFLEEGETQTNKVKDKVIVKVDDKDVLDKLTTTDELSGFLNHALEELRTVLKNKKYSYNKSIDEVETLYKRNSASVYAFADTCLIASSDRTLKYDLYGDYCSWAEAKKISPVHFNIFGKALKAIGYTDYRYTDKDTRETITFWENVEVDPVKFKFEITGKIEDKGKCKDEVDVRRAKQKAEETKRRTEKLSEPTCFDPDPLDYSQDEIPFDPSTQDHYKW